MAAAHLFFPCIPASVFPCSTSEVPTSVGSARSYASNRGPSPNGWPGVGDAAAFITKPQLWPSIASTRQDDSFRLLLDWYSLLHILIRVLLVLGRPIQYIPICISFIATHLNRSDRVPALDPFYYISRPYWNFSTLLNFWLTTSVSFICSEFFRFRCVCSCLFTVAIGACPLWFNWCLSTFLLWEWISKLTCPSQS
jgi:hypothetical protein